MIKDDSLGQMPITQNLNKQKFNTIGDDGYMDLHKEFKRRLKENSEFSKKQVMEDKSRSKSVLKFQSKKSKDQRNFSFSEIN
jgi:hypothetical protein